MAGRFSFSRMSNRERLWALVLACVIVLLAMVRFIVQPVSREFHQLTRQAEIQRKKLAENMTLLAPQAKKFVEDRDRQYGEIVRKHGTAEEEISALIGLVEKLASKHGVTLVATKPHETRVLDAGEEYAVDVDLECDLAALLQFLHELESSPGLLRVSRLTIGPKSEGTGSVLKGSLAVTKLAVL